MTQGTCSPASERPELYEVLYGPRVPCRAFPDSKSAKITFKNKGDVVRTDAWDETCNWRRVWVENDAGEIQAAWMQCRSDHLGQMLLSIGPAPDHSLESNADNEGDHSLGAHNQPMLHERVEKRVGRFSQMATTSLGLSEWWGTTLPPKSSSSQLYTVVFEPHIAVRAFPSMTALAIRALKCGTVVRLFEWDVERKWRRTTMASQVEDLDDCRGCCKIEHIDGWVLVVHPTMGTLLEALLDDGREETDLPEDEGICLNDNKSGGINSELPSQLYTVIFKPRIPVRISPSLSAPPMRALQYGAFIRCFEWDTTFMWRRVVMPRQVEDDDDPHKCSLQQSDGWVLVNHPSQGPLLEQVPEIDLCGNLGSDPVSNEALNHERKEKDLGEVSPGRPSIPSSNERLNHDRRKKDLREVSPGRPSIPVSTEPLNHERRKKDPGEVSPGTPPNIQLQGHHVPLQDAPGDTRKVSSVVALALAALQETAERSHEYATLRGIPQAQRCNSAVSSEVELLLNSVERRPDEPLIMQAARTGSLKVVESVLRRFADPNQVDKLGETALFEAAANAHTDIVARLLLCKSNIDHSSDDGTTALMVTTDDATRTLIMKFKGEDCDDASFARAFGKLADFDQKRMLKVLNISELPQATASDVVAAIEDKGEVLETSMADIFASVVAEAANSTPPSAKKEADEMSLTTCRDEPQSAADTLAAVNSVKVTPMAHPHPNIADELDLDKPCIPSRTEVPPHAVDASEDTGEKVNISTHDVLASVAMEPQSSVVASTELCKSKDEQKHDPVGNLTMSPSVAQRTTDALVTESRANVNPTAKHYYMGDDFDFDEPRCQSRTELQSHAVDTSKDMGEILKIPTADALASVVLEAESSRVPSAELCKGTNEQTNDLVRILTMGPTRDEPQSAADTLAAVSSVKVTPMSRPHPHTAKELDLDEPCIPSRTEVPPNAVDASEDMGEKLSVSTADVLASVAKEAQTSGVASAESYKSRDEKVDDLVRNLTMSPTICRDEPDLDEPCIPSRTEVPTYYRVVYKMVAIREFPNTSAQQLRIKKMGAIVEMFEWDRTRLWRRVLTATYDEENSKLVPTDGWMLIHSQKLGPLLEEIPKEELEDKEDEEVAG